MTDSSTPTAPRTSSAPGTDQLVTTEYSESIPGLVNVRLNRPRKLNSLTIDLLQQLISTAHTLRPTAPSAWSSSPARRATSPPASTSQIR